MKLLIFPLSICFMLLSCGNSKELTPMTVIDVTAESTENDTEEVMGVTEVSEVTEEIEQIRIVGTVHVSESGCKLYIDARENNNSTFTIYPEDLDPRFQVEGMFLKFYYTKTETEIPAGCDLHMSAKLTDVTPLRR